MSYPQNINLAWYCIKTTPKKERLAANLIQREIDDVKTFSPHIGILKKTKRGKVRYVEALFPGYMFTYCNLYEKYRHLLAINGVSGVVQYGDYFPQVPEEFIHDLEAQIGGEIIDAPDDCLDVGKKVIVTEGPFKNFEAVVKGLVPAQERVKLLLEFLGHERAIEISTNSIMTKEQIESPKAFLSKNCG